MKFLKYLLFLLIIVAVGLLIYTAVQPNEYDVKRTKLIKAPASIIYNNINDIKKWDNWGPWHDKDSTIVTTYSDNTVGVGAKSSWTSKDGPGNMKLISTVANKSVDLKMQFYDYNPTDVYWTLDEVDGGTNVTWGMKNTKNPFIFKLFSVLSGGMDNMLGEMEGNGLNNLEKVVLEDLKNNPIPKFKLSNVSIENLPAKNFIGYLQKTSTTAALEDMTKIFKELKPKAEAYAMSKLSHEDFIPGTFYTKWDEETKEAEFYVGVLLKKNLVPTTGMTALSFPTAKSVKISKYGNYGVGDYEAHTAIGKYMQDNTLEMNGTSILELYVNDPMEVKQKDIQTDIYYPIK